MKKNTSFRAYLLLHIALLIYSTSSLFSKNASRHPFPSLPFILFYGGMIAVLGIYAILWQQVIKHLNVTTAYANKAVTVVWGVVLGILFFRERISLRQFIACGIIILGTVLYVRADRRAESGEMQELDKCDHAGECMAANERRDIDECGEAALYKDMRETRDTSEYKASNECKNDMGECEGAAAYKDASERREAKR